MEKKPLDAFNTHLSVKEVLKGDLKSYTARSNKIYHPHFGHFLDDSLSAPLFFIQSVGWTAKTRRMYLGK